MTDIVFFYENSSVLYYGTLLNASSPQLNLALWFWWCTNHQARESIHLHFWWHPVLRHPLDSRDLLIIAFYQSNDLDNIGP